MALQQRTLPFHAVNLRNTLYERKWWPAMIICFVIYVIIMDINLYISLQSTGLVSQVKSPGYSPFSPLTTKLLMTCPTNHYIISTFCEYFDQYTNFSRLFTFITPNMISFTHLALGFYSAFLITHDSLQTRRLGVLVYEIRMFLDVYDGVVFRSHRGLKGYKSIKNSFGYIIDISCDIIGGIALNYGVMFYLWRNFCKAEGAEAGNMQMKEKTSDEKHLRPLYQNNTRLNIFYKALCWGLLMALTGMTWDFTTEKFGEIFEKKRLTTLEQELQTTYLHSISTWIVFYMWRMIEGQALTQYILLAVYIDKPLELLTAFQYKGYIMLAFVNILSQVYLKTLRSAVSIQQTEPLT